MMKPDDLLNVIREKCNLPDDCRMLPLEAGNSLASNYLIANRGEPVFFAKIHDEDNGKRFAAARYLFGQNIPMPEPLAEFDAGDGKVCTLTRWISAEPILPTEKNAKKGAQIIRALHSVEVPPEYPSGNLSAEVQYYLSYFEKADNCPVRFEDIAGVLRQPAPQSPQCSFTHLDVHMRNFVQNGQKLFLIDFENLTVSDPWRDLVYAAFFHNRDENEFWAAFLWEFFRGEPPESFWSTMKYYCYVHLLRMMMCEHKKGNADMLRYLSESVLTNFPATARLPSWMEQRKERKRKTVPL